MSRSLRRDTGVAVVPKLDTGIVIEEEGPDFSDPVTVSCDREKMPPHYKTSKALVVTNEYSVQGRFSLDDIETSIIQKGLDHLEVTVSYSENKSTGDRKAIFRFLLKPGRKGKEGDPFYIVASNGKVIPTFVKSKANA